MGTNLTRIGEKARKDRKLVFTSLYHHISDIDNLRACYDDLPAKKARGEDGVTKSEYGKHLEDNLRDLSARLKRMGYRPGPKRRSYIPKPGSKKGRPLGDVLRSLSKKKMYGSPNSNPSPELGADKENHTSWERYYQVSDCSSSLRNDWYSGI